MANQIENWHSAYQKRVKKLSIESLKFIIQDCKEAISSLPDNPKNGQYSDEICYCSSELYARMKKK